MPTYNSADLSTKPLYAGDDGNANSYYGTSVATSTNLATADKIRVCKVPAGFLVTNVMITNTTFGTTAPATVQFEPLDGTAATNFTAVDAVTLQTASSGTLLVKAPVAVTKDSYVTLLIGTVGTPNGTGVATVVVNGEFLGAK